MKKSALWWQYSLFTVAALVLVSGSYSIMRNWLPVASQNPALRAPSLLSEEEGGEEERSYPLHEAVLRDATEEVKALLAAGADVNELNGSGYSPLMCAAEYGRIQSARLLLQAGADVHLTDKMPPPDYDPVEVLEEVSPQFRAQDEEYKERLRQDLMSLPGETAMAKAANVEIVQLLRKYGADTSHIPNELRARLTGLRTDGELRCTPPQFQNGKKPRYGKANPEKMNVPFWNAMTASGASAYRARKKFGDGEYRWTDAVWSFDRFGKSFTFLPDGRIIEIGGEHEDFSDPDFHIYNDVFVHHGKGRFEIYGYPRSVFPPTDFHSATLVGDFIYIIGGLGYPQDRRPGFTPVYRLNCKTLAMEKVNAKGDNPGWIYDHRATYYAGKGKAGEIHVQGGEVCLKGQGREDEDWAENEMVFVLDLAGLEWRRTDNE